MGTTTDSTDPDLGRGEDTSPVEQNKKYLVLSEEERAKGFVRPYRDSYIHVGIKPKFTLRDLTDEERNTYGDKYSKYEPYPESERPVLGRFWSQDELDAPICNAITKMNREISETYARSPNFYGSTYCIGCRMHKKVAEFVWTADGKVVGS